MFATGHGFFPGLGPPPSHYCKGVRGKRPTSTRGRMPPCGFLPSGDVKERARD
ncbi:hypothetical protein BMF35_a1639 [Aurantiacibacter gangjinensis]|nr:hypothetical protein BMF35_a1639 [Aurantiacibacter gangjinensis]